MECGKLLLPTLSEPEQNKSAYCAMLRPDCAGLLQVGDAVKHLARIQLHVAHTHRSRISASLCCKWSFSSCSLFFS